jgi:fructoselysine 6-kinase
LSRLVSVGDNVVDTYRDLRLRFPGGNAVNVAVVASRCGLGSAYVGAVGNDGAGEAIRAALVAEGVAIDRLRELEGETAFCLIELDGGDRNFVDHGLGISRFALDRDDFAYLAGFDCIHTGDNSGLEDQLPQMAAAGPVSYDFSDRPFSYCEPLLGHVWLASFSASKLTRSTADVLAEKALELGPSYVLMTRGEDGALFFGKEIDPLEVPAVPVPPVDTLGAGDTVIGCVLAGLLKQEEPAVFMEEAMLRAAATCREYGAFGHGLASA